MKERENTIVGSSMETSHGSSSARSTRSTTQWGTGFLIRLLQGAVHRPSKARLARRARGGDRGLLRRSAGGSISDRPARRRADRSRDKIHQGSGSGAPATTAQLRPVFRQTNRIAPALRPGAKVLPRDLRIGQAVIRPLPRHPRHRCSLTMPAQHGERYRSVRRRAAPGCVPRSDPHPATPPRAAPDGTASARRSRPDGPPEHRGTRRLPAPRRPRSPPRTRR